jgi:hypothetical protein
LTKESLRCIIIKAKRKREKSKRIREDKKKSWKNKSAHTKLLFYVLWKRIAGQLVGALSLFFAKWNFMRLSALDKRHGKMI